MIIFWLTCLVGYPRTSAPEPIFLSRFAGVAYHLCCQVALGEAEGAALGVPTVHIKKMADLQLNKCYKGILFRPLGCFVGYLL